MLIRALDNFVFCFIGVMVYEVVYHKYFKNKDVPLTVGFISILLSIGSRLSAFFIGILLTRYYYISTDHKTDRILPILGGFLALYAVSILLQVGQNIVRASIGAPVLPIEWIRWKKNRDTLTFLSKRR